MKCHSLDRIFTLLALCCGGLFTGAQDVGDKSQVSPSQRDLSLRDQVNIHVKNAPRVVVFPPFPGFTSSNKGLLTDFVVPAHQVVHLLVSVEPDNANPPPRADSDWKVEQVANCTVGGSSVGGFDVTLTSHTDFPFLRVQSSPKTGDLNCRCVLEQNDVYINYVVPDGLERLKAPGSVPEIIQQGKFASLHPSSYKSYSSHQRSPLRFDIRKSNGALRLAQCYATGLIPLGDVPTVTLSGVAPFVKVKGIANKGKTIPTKGLFSIKCTAV